MLAHNFVDIAVKLNESSLHLSLFNQALNRMKEDWKDVEFVFVQYKDTGLSILSAVDDLQVRIDQEFYAVSPLSLLLSGGFHSRRSASSTGFA